MSRFHTVGLRDDLGRKMYCGRFALISATGESCDQVTALINKHRKAPAHKHVASSTYYELRYTLKKLGYNQTGELLWSRPLVKTDGHNYRKPSVPTFTQWIKKEQHSRTDTYIVLITDHWIVVKGDWLTDTFNRTPVDLSSSKNPYARKRVQAVIRIHQQEQAS